MPAWKLKRLWKLFAMDSENDVGDNADDTKEDARFVPSVPTSLSWGTGHNLLKKRSCGGGLC